jgi:hypothetical protein
LVVGKDGNTAVMIFRGDDDGAVGGIMDGDAVCDTTLGDGGDGVADVVDVTTAGAMSTPLSLVNLGC